MMKFDLHCHSEYSHDCEVPPQEQLAAAEAVGLDYFSITDHNSAEAHLRLQDPALRHTFSGKLIPAAELSAAFDQVNVEILGYGIDPQALQERIRETYCTNEEKFRFYGQELIRACRAAGAMLNEQRVEEFLQMPLPSRKVLQEMLKEFPENRRLFLFDESWENYNIFLRHETNNPESPLFAHLSKIQPTPEHVAKMIRDCGGMVFLAHPLIYSKNVTDRLEELIDRVQPDGLECFYPAFSAEQIEHLLSICKDRDLFASGGSDNHGPKRPNPLGAFGRFQARAAEEVTRWIHSVKTY